MSAQCNITQYKRYGCPLCTHTWLKYVMLMTDADMFPSTLHLTERGVLFCYRIAGKLPDYWCSTKLPYKKYIQQDSCMSLTQINVGLVHVYGSDIIHFWEVTFFSCFKGCQLFFICYGDTVEGDRLSYREVTETGIKPLKHWLLITKINFQNKIKISQSVQFCVL